MDKQFVIITHGNFAVGIKSSLEMLIGEYFNVIAIPCYTDQNFNLEVTIENILEKYKDKKLIFLSDIFGGSVNNYILGLVDDKKIFLITGINLPLLIDIISNQDYIDDKYINKVINESKNQIKWCNKIILTESEDDF